MFEQEILKRNKELINFVKSLHDRNLINPDTYVIDLDSVAENAIKLKKKADELNIHLFQMTKQFGRNPVVANYIKQAGIDEAVAVDWREAEILFNNGIKIGNIGHVVQVPKNFIPNIIKMDPRVWTIYSYGNLLDINNEAEKLDKVQEVIIRVYDNQENLYDSQKGGVSICDLEKFLKDALKLENIKIVGLTSFPCLLFDDDNNIIKPTKNIEAVKKAIGMFKKHGINVKHINIPSANNTKSLELVAKIGGNFAEPGHAFTGTTPINKEYKNIEKPAMLYYSQVSHTFENKVVVFAGGHYRRGRMKEAFIGEELVSHSNIPISNEAIDYYFEFSKINIYNAKPGDMAIMAFRSQIFVTRSKVLLVKGLSENKGEVIGLYDSQGRELNE